MWHWKQQCPGAQKNFVWPESRLGFIVGIVYQLLLLRCPYRCHSLAGDRPLLTNDQSVIIHFKDNVQFIIMIILFSLPCTCVIL